MKFGAITINSILFAVVLLIDIVICNLSDQIRKENQCQTMDIQHGPKYPIYHLLQDPESQESSQDFCKLYIEDQ